MRVGQLSPAVCSSDEVRMWIGLTAGWGRPALPAKAKRHFEETEGRDAMTSHPEVSSQTDATQSRPYPRRLGGSTRCCPYLRARIRP